MNVLVACNEKYLELVRYMLFSLRIHNEFLNIYLIHENVSESSISELESFFRVHDIGCLNVIKFDSSQIELPLKDDEITGHITKEAYFRLYAPFFLPTDMERILYLDCDIICVDNIMDFYNMDFENHILCGCFNADSANDKYIERLKLPKGSIYINSGVLLFNLKLYREYTSLDKLNRFITENAAILNFQDQDVVNKMFFGRILFCDVKYNFQIGMLLYNEGGKLIHYTGPNKPWYDDYNRPFLAQPFYDVLFKLGEVKRLKYKRNRHVNNFKKTSKLASVIVSGERIDEDMINNVLCQLENRVEFIITYTEIDDALIHKYSEHDCRVIFLKKEELNKYYTKLLGYYCINFNIDDFKEMDVNFIREIVYFAGIEQLPFVFYKNFNLNNNRIIVDFGRVISDVDATKLIDENALDGYNCIYLADFSQNNNSKYGYFE